MLLSELTETNYQFYNLGRPKTSSRTYDKKDIRQFIKLSCGNLFRFNFYNNLRMTGAADYSFINPLLSLQTFALSDPNAVGMRRADMSDFDMYRLPHSAHIQNVYPTGCEGSEGNSIPILDSGEEYFYAKPKFKSFKFGVVKGRGINTYHLRPCTKTIIVEAAFDGKNEDGSDIDVDIPLDIAYDASNEVLSRMIGIPDVIGKNIDNPYALPFKNLKPKPQPQPE